MMVATCGHDVYEEKEQGIMIALADYSRNGNRVVRYPCVCEKCLLEYKKFDSYLPTEEDIENWFKYGKKPNKF